MENTIVGLLTFFIGQPGNDYEALMLYGVACIMGTLIFAGIWMILHEIAYTMRKTRESYADDNE
jgi:undecaprenyl pyrophosphate phosphatase UppP